MKKGLFCILVCMLMIVSTIIPVSGTTVSEKTSQPLTMGSILYVGGSGPNNFTKIQDAIDNASDGDTVFVYDDSSPYYEHIVVGKSITLQGENKYTTIIDGANTNNGINIIVDDVTITGFTIQNCYRNGTLIPFISGILLSSNNNKIMDNILLQNHYGISNMINYSLPQGRGYNTIINNQFIHNEEGIYFSNASNDIISGNIISQSDSGIMIIGAMNTNISFNLISENGGGIMVILSYNTMIYRNNISDNKIGVAILDTTANQILQNNFIRNKKFSAISSQQLCAQIMFTTYWNLYFNAPYQKNVWNQNYWDRPRMFPHVIFGLFKLTFSIDWHPAQEPYEI